MSQDSNFSDENIAQGPSGEPSSETPSGRPPSVPASPAAAAEMAEPPSPSTPLAPAETPVSEAPESTVDSFNANGYPASPSPSPSPSLTPDPVDTAPPEASFAPVPLPPSSAPQYQNQQPQVQQQGAFVQVQARNPLLYAVVDFLITGLGLMVQGRVGLGILFLGINIVASFLLFIPILGWIVFFLVMLPVWIISMAMAFTTAKAWNRQHGIIS